MATELDDLLAGAVEAEDSNGCVSVCVNVPREELQMLGTMYLKTALGYLMMRRRREQAAAAAAEQREPCGVEQVSEKIN